MSHCLEIRSYLHQRLAPYRNLKLSRSAGPQRAQSSQARSGQFETPPPRHPRSPDGDCHRYTVAKLLIKAARRHETPLEVVQWPGGEPSTFKVEVARSEVPKDATPRLHLPGVRPLSKFAGLAVGSLVDVVGDERERRVAVAPAMYAPKGWYLPILKNERGKVIDGTAREATRWRRKYGYLPLRT